MCHHWYCRYAGFARGSERERIRTRRGDAGVVMKRAMTPGLGGVMAAARARVSSGVARGDGLRRGAEEPAEGETDTVTDSTAADAGRATLGVAVVGAGYWGPN